MYIGRDSKTEYCTRGINVHNYEVGVNLNIMICIFGDWCAVFEDSWR